MKKFRDDYISQNTRSPKVFLYVCLSVLAVVDFTVMLLLMLSGSPAKYFVFPLLAFIVDAGFLVLSVFTNFRFKYSIAEIVVFAVLSVLLTALQALVNGTGRVETLSHAAIAFWTVTHIVSIVSIIVACLFASKKVKGHRSVKIAIAIVVTVIGCAGILNYGYFVIDKGFFGQGADTRALEYVLLSETDTYAAVGTVGGNSPSVFVPKTFNGKAVSEVDVSLLGDASIEQIEFESANDVTLYGFEKLLSVNGNLKVIVQKDEMDGFRSKIFEFSGLGSSAFAIANSVEPKGLANDEVFVRFDYDAHSFERVGGKVLPTWFGKKGESIDKALYEEFEYVANCNVESELDLQFAFNNYGGEICNLHKILGGQKVNENVEFNVGFDRIYCLSFREDNDTAFELPENFKYIVRDGVALSGARYLFKDDIDPLLASVSRDGFGLKWRASSSPTTPVSAYTVFQGADHISAGHYNLYLSAEWSLNAPTVSVGPPQSAVYGESASLSATLSDTLDWCAYSFEWRKSESVLSTSATYVKNSVSFADEGKYYVTVTAGAPSVTSLTSQVTKQVAMDVTERPLVVEWDMPSQKVYDGNYILAKCDILGVQQGSGIINGDDVELVCYVTIQNTNCGESVKDAGSYVAKFVTSGRDEDKYYISNKTDFPFVIEQATIHVTWSETEFTYDGEMHTPVITYNPTEIVSGDDIGLTRTGAVNASTVSYVSQTTLANGNYKLDKPTCSFNINPREVSLSWDEVLNFNYNGKEQSPKVVSVSNDVPRDNLLSKISYVGDLKNAGSEKTVTATISDKNYVISAGSEKRTYAISVAPLSIDWGQTSFEYNRQAHNPSPTATIIFENDNIGLSVTTDRADRTSAGGFTATAHITNANYVITENLTQNFVISQAPLTLSWGSAELTYSGSAQKPTASIASGRYAGDVINVSVSGAQTNTNESSGISIYTATASIDNDNYKIAIGNESKEFKILPRNLTFVWSSASIEYNGQKQHPTVISANGAVGSEHSGILSAITYSDDGVKDVQSASITAVYVNANYNVVSSSQTKNYQITKKNVTLTWDRDSFVYNGQKQRPSVTAVSGAVSGEESAVLASISYGDDGVKDVQRASVTASCSNGNYSLANAVKSYSIVEATLTLFWGTVEFECDGNSHSPSPSISSGLCEGDSVTVTVSGTGTEVGEYTAVASVNSHNYVIANNTMKFYVVASNASGVDE